jgi:type IV secretory pathway TrbL component
MVPTPDSYPILNQAQTDFINVINTIWYPVLQQYGVRILLALAVLEIGLLGLDALRNRDFPGMVSDLTRVLLGIGVVYVVFSNAQPWGTAVVDTFLQIGKATSGMSPDVLTPSGIMQTGFGLARIFWTASGRAGWLMSPSSAATTFFCTIVVVLAYAGAAIIYLLTLIRGLSCRDRRECAARLRLAPLDLGHLSPLGGCGAWGWGTSNVPLNGFDSRSRARAAMV